MSGPRSRELDDDSLLSIFSKVGCARQLARSALVCKRWRDLSCAVSHLDFDFNLLTQEQLETKEGIVSTVLCRASSRAPGSLKHLKVSFICCSLEAVNGRWLRWATSLTKLELVAVGFSAWGVAVWNTIMRMKNLEEGSFRTGKRSLLPQVLASEFQMPRLQKCKIARNYNVPVVLLDTILAKCPALTELVISDCQNRRVKALRVASNSLKICTLFLHFHPDGFDVTVHAPELKTLILATFKPVRIYFESAQSLRTLSLESSHKLFYNVPENLQNLDVSMHGDPQRLPRMLMLTPMITELYLGSVYEGKGDINIDRILAPLVNLRDIYFQGHAMSHFQAGKRKCDGLNVHFQPCHSSPDVCLLKALIEVHKIQTLVVYCEEMLDYETKAVKTGYEGWRLLFELSFFYPDRVKFVHDFLCDLVYKKVNQNI